MGLKGYLTVCHRVHRTQVNVVSAKELINVLLKHTKFVFGGALPGRKFTAVESRKEGLILKLAARATAGSGKGRNAFDRTLTDSAAAGMLASH